MFWMVFDNMREENKFEKESKVKQNETVKMYIESTNNSLFQSKIEKKKITMKRDNRFYVNCEYQKVIQLGIKLDFYLRAWD